MIGTLPGLEKLEVAGLAMRDGHVAALAPFLPGLTHIDLSDCPIGDEALVSLAGHCTRLRHVQLSHCESISDRGVLSLVEHLPLNHLECDNTAITNGVLSAVAMTPQPMRLSIYDCPEVTWTGVLSILTANSANPERMTRLKTFYGWQRPVDGHTKRLLRGEVAAAREVERAWARYMMDGSEEAMRSGGHERGTRLLDFDDESTQIIGRDRRRQSRQCRVM